MCREVDYDECLRFIKYKLKINLLEYQKEIIKAFWDDKEVRVCRGGGDWGLSCRKDYYNCSTNGFDKACEHFERK